jgi:hypothetical protein
MKTSTKTKTKTARIVIGELPSAGTSGPLNLNSAAVATVHGGSNAFNVGGSHFPVPVPEFQFQSWESSVLTNWFSSLSPTENGELDEYIHLSL